MADTGRNQDRKESTMEASSGRTRTRLIFVDFLSTLFVVFCIGVATALLLGTCVVLMSGDARGVAPAKPAPAAGVTTADLVLAHYFAAKYAGLVVVDRLAATGPMAPARDPSGCTPGRSD
jgi:hypothetical protein